MNDLVDIHRLCAVVDGLILEEHRLDPFELLMALELLDYVDYDAWRTGRRAEIETAIRVPAAEAAGLLGRAGDYARRQGLAAVQLEHRGWGGHDRTLGTGPDQALARALALAWEPAADRLQLDLFHDGTAALLENEIRRALCERRVDAARRSVARLMQQAPGHGLGSYLRLVEALEDQAGLAAGKRRPKARLAELESIDALACKLLGRRARDLVDPLWSAFAESLAGQPFDPAAPALHAAAAWRRAGRWQQVRESVQGEPHWRDRPELLLAHAEACRRTRDLAAAMTDWMWLCWEHPEAAESALDAGALGDLVLAGDWRAFLDLDPELPVEDFPAWLLLRDKGLAAAVAPEAAPGDERGEPYRLLHRLVTGEDSIDTRRALSEVHPGLLRLFLAKRA
jgi:hypothetical protein